MFSKMEDDTSSSSNSTLPWLAEGSHSISWSDEDETTSSPLMSSSNNYPLHDPSAGGGGFYNNRNSNSNNNNNNSRQSRIPKSITRFNEKEKRRKSIEYELKNSQDVLRGSASAVINFLKLAGIPKPR